MQQGQVTYRGMPPAQFRDDIVAIDAPHHADAQKFLGIWRARAADGMVVGRDIPSRAIAPLLSHLVVWEPVDEGANFQVRLAGDALHRRFDGDIKGRRMTELFPPTSVDKHIAFCREVTVTGQPSVQRANLTCGTVLQLCADIVTVPVIPPDRIGVWAMSGAFFF